MIRFFFSPRGAVPQLAAWAALAACVGCGEKPKPTGALVTGVVTYNGSPVAGATVSFISVAGAPGYGMTDEQGHFSLRSAQGEGVSPGEYQVTVTKTDAPPPGAPTMSVEEYVPPDPNAPPPPPPKDLVPAKYKDPQTSTLKATVTDSGPNDFTFPLTD